MKYSAWQSVKNSWPDTSLWQKVLIVLAFPVIFAFLGVIAWRMNKNGDNTT